MRLFFVSISKTAVNISVVKCNAASINNNVLFSPLLFCFCSMLYLLCTTHYLVCRMCIGTRVVDESVQTKLKLFCLLATGQSHSLVLTLSCIAISLRVCVYGCRCLDVYMHALSQSLNLSTHGILFQACVRAVSPCSRTSLFGLFSRVAA